MPKLSCQAVGCPCARQRWQFMCTAHWKALPGPLRAQVNATWRAFQTRKAGEGPELILAWTEACDEARRLTADREGKLADYVPELPRLQARRDAIRDHAGIRMGEQMEGPFNRTLQALVGNKP